MLSDNENLDIMLGENHIMQEREREKEKARERERERDESLNSNMARECLVMILKRMNKIHM